MQTVVKRALSKSTYNRPLGAGRLLKLCAEARHAENATFTKMFIQIYYLLRLGN